MNLIFLDTETTGNDSSKDRLCQEEVLKSDKGYLEWLLNQKLTSGDQDEDWIYTLQYYLKI